MNATEAAALADTFLRAWLDAPQPADAGFSLSLLRVEPEGERGFRAVFGADVPFRMGDTRVPERVNAGLGALLAAHPALRPFRIDVTVDTLDAA
jgi:hypothetical protein